MIEHDVINKNIYLDDVPLFGVFMWDGKKYVKIHICKVQDSGGFWACQNEDGNFVRFYKNEIVTYIGPAAGIKFQL